MYLNHADLSKYFVCDIETNPLPNVTKIHCAVVKNVATLEVFKFYGENFYKEFKSFVDNNKDAYWVGHNFLSFDAYIANRVAGIVFPVDRIIDTLVLSTLYHPNMPNGHSLSAYGERLGFPKDTFDDFSQFSPALLERCEIDVELNRLVFLALTKKMRTVGFSERSCEIEHRIRGIIDQQERNGFFFDTPKADMLYAKLINRKDTLEADIHKIFPPTLEEFKRYAKSTKADGSPTATYLRHQEEFPKLSINRDGTYTSYAWKEFNIGSPAQRLEKLLGLGFKPTKKTKGGGPSVDEESLIEFAKESGIKEVNYIGEYLVTSSRASSVRSWLDILGDDSRIHGRVYSCGAASRRMTHSAPNTANVASNEAMYGRECRELWRAPEGRKLLGYDAKAAQMRCFAHYLPNPQDGIRFFTEGHDPHQENADIIGITRKQIKNVFYANLFGAFPPKLATTAGKVGTYKELEEYGTWVQAELFKVTPGLQEATESARDEQRATPEGWMRCLDGGFVRGPSEHAALNYRIQPAEAVLMKQTTIFINERAQHLDHIKVGDIHDEGQHEVSGRDAEELGRIAVQAARDAGESLGLRVPFDGDYKIGNNWSETH